MSKPSTSPHCVNCGNPLADPARYNWEGEPWCPQCVRELRVEPVGAAPLPEYLETPLAWEGPLTGLGPVVFARTWWMLCVHPVRFFQHMGRHAVQGRSLIFVVLVGAVAAILSLPGTRYGTSLVLPAVARFHQEMQEPAKRAETPAAGEPLLLELPVLRFSASDLLHVLLYQWLLVVVEAVCTGVLLHLCLVIFGEDAPFEVTLRIQRYAAGACVLLVFPSVLGAVLWPVYQTLLAGVGLHVCHGIRYAKALGAAALACWLFHLMFSLALVRMLGG